MILTKDGRASVNFEHSWGDGVAVLRYFNEVWKETTTKPFVHPDTTPANVDSSSIVQHLGIYSFLASGDLSSTDQLFKQFGPSSLIVFLKEFLLKNW